MHFLVITQSEKRLINAAGEITRAACDWKYSGDWKALALVRPTGYGIAELIPFAHWPHRVPTLQWLYKNGKPRFTVRDLDHGTTREWGNMVRSIDIIREG